jgi:hypothetical protein
MKSERPNVRLQDGIRNFPKIHSNKSNWYDRMVRQSNPFEASNSVTYSRHARSLPMGRRQNSTAGFGKGLDNGIPVIRTVSSGFKER